MRRVARFFYPVVNAFAVLSTSVASIHAESDRQEQFTAEHPNIIFFLIDDQRNDTLGCAGHRIIQTPVIDELAAEGIRFENAFVTTSICAASRASILTGLYERTHGFTFNKPPVSAEHLGTSYPVVLREAGYRTGFFGKYGILGELPPEELFDEFKAIDWNPFFKEQEDGTLRHETDLCADEAIAFINSNPKQQPFCLSISFNAAHAEDSDLTPGKGHFPWPPSADGMYEDVVIPPPRLNDPAIFASQPEFLQRSLNRKRYFWRWDTPEKYQTNMRAYFRMISGIDNAIGRIIQTLKKEGLEENTVIIYMADNGYYMGDRGFAGKWSHYEQSLRVPLIIYDPRQPLANRGRVLDAFALNIDVAPTLAEIAGLEVPRRYQGASLLPFLQNERPLDWRRDFFAEHLMEHMDIPKWEGVRGERFVYARYFEQKPAYEFLHDLEADPDQLVNLAGSADKQDLLDNMRKRSERLLSQIEKGDASCP